MRHVFETMGTVASVELPEAAAHLLPALEGVFREWDERFSLYRAESELSRVADGRLALRDASAVLRDSYARALGWSSATGGLFSPHRPDGVIDLNGIVKAEAIEAAGLLLERSGIERWMIAVGGDILCSRDEGPRALGIADPANESALLCSVLLEDGRRAVATSGSAQRGDHIWLGGERLPARFVQASVVANDIVTADVLATAIIAGGPDALDEITDSWPVDVLTVDREGALLATPGFRQAVAALG